MSLIRLWLTGNGENLALVVVMEKAQPSGYEVPPPYSDDPQDALTNLLSSAAGAPSITAPALAYTEVQTQQGWVHNSNQVQVESVPVQASSAAYPVQQPQPGWIHNSNQVQAQQGWVHNSNQVRVESVPVQASSAAYPVQQPQQGWVPNPNQVRVESVPLIQSYASHIVLACLTFWFCGCVFGLIAFILAGRSINL